MAKLDDWRLTCASCSTEIGNARCPNCKRANVRARFFDGQAVVLECPRCGHMEHGVTCQHCGQFNYAIIARRFAMDWWIIILFAIVVLAMVIAKFSP